MADSRPDHAAARERKRTKEDLLVALADFDAEAILSLVRPGRLGQIKQRLYLARVAFEKAEAESDA